MKSPGQQSAFEATRELKDGSWVPIMFSSTFLNDQKIKLTTDELELLAIVVSCKLFRKYLLGSQFEVLPTVKSSYRLLKPTVKTRFISRGSLDWPTGFYNST